MGARYVPPHWLSTNEKVWSPDNLVVFDTETRWKTGEKAELHAGRCWAASLTLRHSPLNWPDGRADVNGTDFDQLAEVVDEWAGWSKETWCFAHNLGFDITISALPVRLERYGWTVADFWLGDESTWLVLKRKGHKLVLTDSWSWLHTTLAEIARTMRWRKLKLPKNDSDDSYWLAPRRVDPEILPKAQ